MSNEPVTFLRSDSLLPGLVRKSLALTHVGLQGAGELTRLVAETHATISAAPLPWRQDGMEPAHRAPFPYRLVAQGFLHLARLAHSLLGQSSIPAAERGQLFYSALNGVCGDKLEAWDSPLAQSMMLCDEHGQPLTPRWARESGEVVIFLHGLCLSEREWQTPAHTAFVTALRAQGHAVAWLRYNSGRPIHENGASLSALLERQFATSTVRLTLIGHSMGGLLIRSACHHASKTNAAWLSHLYQAAYLAAPHLGAPLERMGNALNNTLGLTPYSRPLMRLGNIRSQGIRDLRHGRLHAEDDNAPLHPGVRHFLLAVHMGTDEEGHWMGDGLVPVRSALGQHLDADRALNAPDLTRRELTELNHMAVLRDERVYRELEDWMVPAR
jgi:pimeloyl-ACP methyl ester carboxylesterase